MCYVSSAHTYNTAWTSSDVLAIKEVFGCHSMGGQHCTWLQFTTKLLLLSCFYKQVPNRMKLTK